MKRALAMDLVDTPCKSRQRLSSISDVGDVGGTRYVDDSGSLVGVPAVGLVPGAGSVARGVIWPGAGAISSVASVANDCVHHPRVASDSLGDFVPESMPVDGEGDVVCCGSQFGENLSSGCHSDSTMPYIGRSCQISVSPGSDSGASLDRPGDATAAMHRQHCALMRLLLHSGGLPNLVVNRGGTSDDRSPMQPRDLMQDFSLASQGVVSADRPGYFGTGSADG